MNDRKGTSESASQGFARGVGTFAHDVLTLAELQAELLAADVRECRQSARIPALLLLCGLAVTISCFPVALTALALFLTRFFETSYACGFLLAFLIGAVVGVALIGVGWFQVSRRVAVLRRSQQELIRNLRWIRKVLDHSRNK